jgi:hypothetical protein
MPVRTPPGTARRRQDDRSRERRQFGAPLPQGLRPLGRRFEGRGGQCGLLRSHWARHGAYGDTVSTSVGLFAASRELTSIPSVDVGTVTKLYVPFAVTSGVTLYSTQAPDGTEALSSLATPSGARYQAPPRQVQPRQGRRRPQGPDRRLAHPLYQQPFQPSPPRATDAVPASSARRS